MSLPAEVYKEILELQNESEDQRKEKERLEYLAKECEKRIVANSNKLNDYMRANVLLKDVFNTIFISGRDQTNGIRFEANSGYTTPGVRDAACRIVNYHGYDLKLEDTFYTLTVKNPQVVDERDEAMQTLSTPAEEIGQGCPVHPRNCPGECVHK